MSLRFSDHGPEFPEQLVDALLKGDVVFLCGAGVSAPQLPGFGGLVSDTFADLNVEMTPSEARSFREFRFEEALGSLSRRIVEPEEMIRSVVRQLQPPHDADLSHHRAILRLSRDLDNRPVIVTTNFDTLIERALLEIEALPQVQALSSAGQDLPLPGSAGFGGIIHIHGRIGDDIVGVEQTPLVLTSADYGDAYMRAGWASRFLFDLCRCKTVVLVGYSAGDAPVRYFLNVLDADRQRFPDLKPVYAIDGVVDRDQDDERWAALAVTLVPYKLLPDADGQPKSHTALWTDLERLADLVERPRPTRRDWAIGLLTNPVSDTSPDDLDHAAWLFAGRRDLWSIAIDTVADRAWLDFFADRKLWSERDATWIVAAWVAKDLQSVDRLRCAIDWQHRLGRPFNRELARRIGPAAASPAPWLRLWRLVTTANAESRDDMEERAYSLMATLQGAVVLGSDVERATRLLAPRLELRSGVGLPEDDVAPDHPQRLSDFCWPRLTVPDQAGASELMQAIAAAADPLRTLEIVTSELRSATALSVDAGMLEGDVDPSEYSVPSVEPHGQNEHHDGPVFLVELIARVLAAATAQDREAVRAIATGWRSLGGTLGLRLLLHAFRDPALFSADEALTAIVDMPIAAFWTIRRELALAIRERAAEAEPGLAARVETRTLAEGPDYYARFQTEEGQADWRSHALDAAIWLRLNMLAEAGRLSADGVAALAAIRERRAYLDREVAEKDFFGSYSTGVRLVVGDAQTIIDATDGERLQVARAIIASPDIDKQQGWSAFCRSDPRGAFDTLREAPLDDANAPLWLSLLGALSFPDGDPDPNRRALVVAVFAALEPAPPEFVEQVVDRLADLYWSAPRRAEPAISAWWQRLFAAAVSGDRRPLDPTRSLYGDLINTPGGRLTQAALIDIDGFRQAGEPVPQPLLDALATAADAPGRQGAMARGALVYATGFVLTLEGLDVAARLERALGGDDEEGIALRHVLVASSQLSSVASRTFPDAILRGLTELTGQGREASHAAAKIIGAAISIVRGEKTEADWGISLADVARALRTGPSALRIGAADLLTQWIHQIADDRAVAWRTGIGPTLDRVWPRERRFVEQGLSRSFADVAVSSGEAFPEALRQLLPFITLLEGHGGTFTIDRSTAPDAFPDDTLVLLWRLFGPGTTSDLHGVPKILERLVTARPAIETDRRLQWLDQRAVRYE